MGPLPPPFSVVCLLAVLLPEVSRGVFSLPSPSPHPPAAPVSEALCLDPPLGVAALPLWQQNRGCPSPRGGGFPGMGAPGRSSCTFTKGQMVLLQGRKQMPGAPHPLSTAGVQESPGGYPLPCAPLSFMPLLAFLGFVFPGFIPTSFLLVFAKGKKLMNSTCTQGGLSSCSSVPGTWEPQLLCWGQSRGLVCSTS